MLNKNEKKYIKALLWDGEAFSFRLIQEALLQDLDEVSLPLNTSVAEKIHGAELAFWGTHIII